MHTTKIRPSLFLSVVILLLSLSGNGSAIPQTGTHLQDPPARITGAPSEHLVNKPSTTPFPEQLLAKSPTTLVAEEKTLDIWTIVQVNEEMELIPGIGLRTTAIFSQNGIQVKAYCLDPGLPIPPVNTQCSRDEFGVFHCKNHQRFKVVPSSSESFDCTRLGLGLHVLYGKETSIAPAKLASLHMQTNSNFWLDPLAVAPDEIWHDEPIRMRSPNQTCGKFTVFGKSYPLPPEVVKVEVFVDCPGSHLDLSTEAADGNYCFGCRGIHFSQKTCTVANRLYIEKDDQAFICQAFYQVIDP